MALICIFVGNLLSGKLKLSISAKIFFWALLVLMLTNLSYKNMNFKMDLNQNSVNTWRTNRFVRSLEGFPSTPILNLSHQKDIINFFPHKQIDNIFHNSGNIRTLNPVEQLILAIPPQTYKYVIEKELINKIKSNINIGYMFPESFGIDINKEYMFYKCMVKIPIVEYKEYEKCIKELNIKNEKNEIYGIIKNF